MVCTNSCRYRYIRLYPWCVQELREYRYIRLYNIDYTWAFVLQVECFVWALLVTDLWMVYMILAGDCDDVNPINELLKFSDQFWGWHFLD